MVYADVGLPTLHFSCSANKKYSPRPPENNLIVALWTSTFQLLPGSPVLSTQSVNMNFMAKPTQQVLEKYWRGDLGLLPPKHQFIA